MQKLGPIQIFLIAFFILVTVVAVLIFGGVLPGFRQAPGPVVPIGLATRVSLWGTAPSDASLVKIFDKFKENSGIAVDYRHISEPNYIGAVTEALASGTGPDLWILKENELLASLSKIHLVPLASYPERSFRDQFLDEAADLLVWAEGYAGFPLTVDPLVLYWNRALFRAASIAAPPKTWPEFVSFSEKLTKIDSSGNILQSGAALGEFANIKPAKDILALLMLQSQNPIVEITKIKISEEQNRSQFTSALNQAGGASLPAAESAARFFSDFSNPRKTSYSWSRVLPNAEDSFIQGRLAMYIGPGSEYRDIINKNPHLDFDVAEVPQISSGPGLAAIPASGFGHLNILVISKQAPQDNKNSAMRLISHLTLDQTTQEALAKDFGHAPVLRSLLASPPGDPITSIMYHSAIKARGWLDPDPRATEAIFSEIVNSSLSRSDLLREALNKANNKLQALLDKINSQEIFTH